MDEVKKEPKETTALEKLNKIITGVCAFLLVLVVNDMRSSLSDIKADVKQASALYSDLNTRVTIIEYSMGIKPVKGEAVKPTSLNQRVDSISSNFSHLVYTKPDEYEFKGPSEEHSE